MVEKLIKHLEGLGYTYVDYDAQRSSEWLLFLSGVDSLGRPIEFKYYVDDGYLMDKTLDSRFWDILEKVDFS